jgi:glutathione S-transferase
MQLPERHMVNNLHTLYGTPLSLYTGKARSYLIKNRLDYQELTPTTTHFRDLVRPHAGGHSIPIMETADGQVIRDSTAIIDHFEALGGGLAMPVGPKKRFLARLFDVIGSEGMLRPAMHYRWNYPAENLAFLAFHFQSMVPPDRDRVALAEKTMQRMRNAGQAFGAVESTFELVEGMYARFLELFNQHLRAVPYVLGGLPSIADYGMMAPMYAHLGRDPKPLGMMQQQAIQVFRWVERMNRPELDSGEFPVEDSAFLAANSLANDEVPATLINLLTHIGKDLVPETVAAAAVINQWLDDQLPLALAPVERSVGFCEFSIEGQSVSAMAQPYRFYLLARAQHEYNILAPADQAMVRELTDACGLTPLLSTTLSREIGRHNNQEVWV